MHNQDQINQLHQKLELLLKRQELFSKEVQELQEALLNLKRDEVIQPFEKEAVKED